MEINRFRLIRFLLSLIACIVRVLIHLNVHFDIISRLSPVGIGIEIIVFGQYFLAATVSHYVLKAFFKEGIIEKYNLANLIADTLIYLIFCIIVILFCLLLWWLFIWLILLMGGAPHPS